MRGVRVDLTALLFGDILAASWTDVRSAALGSALVLGLLAATWRGLVAASVDEDLSRAEGVRVGALSILFMLLVAATVALAMEVVGVLLVTALIVIPAMTARRFSRSPEAMAMLAPMVGVAAVALGLALSWLFDTPSGPSIVVAAFSLFLAATLLGAARGEA